MTLWLKVFFSVVLGVLCASVVKKERTIWLRLCCLVCCLPQDVSGMILVAFPCLDDMAG